jgi:hypothetical protein
VGKISYTKKVERRNMWGNDDTFFGKELSICKGKTIKDFIAFSPMGYDMGFEIEFTDGTKVELEPIPIPIKSDNEVRLRIKLIERRGE